MAGVISDQLSDTGCAVQATVPRLGVYDVVAAQLENGKPTGATFENKQVVVQDWLIVGLGDSNGSGEGNPAATGNKWLFAQCDRSLASYQYRAAQYVQDSDPRSSVTFLLASCSGAKTFDLWQHPYPGIQPTLGAPLPPQIDRIQSLIGPRKVNAVLMSIGINDIGFGPLMTFCITTETLHVNPLLPACESAGVDAAQRGSVRLHLRQEVQVHPR